MSMWWSHLVPASGLYASLVEGTPGNTVLVRLGSVFIFLLVSLGDLWGYCACQIGGLLGVSLLVRVQVF